MERIERGSIKWFEMREMVRMAGAFYLISMGGEFHA